MVSEDRLLSESEASTFLGVSPSTLNAWRVRRQGPAFVKLGRRVLYKPADLTAFVDGQRKRTDVGTRKAVPA